MPKQQDLSLAHHCLQANEVGMDPPKCFLTVECTKICTREHSSGRDDPLMALRLEEKSYDSVTTAICVGGQAQISIWVAVA